MKIGEPALVRTSHLPETADDISGNSRALAGRSGFIIGVGAVRAILGALSMATQRIWSIAAGLVIEIDTPILGTTLYAAEIALFA